MKVFVHGGAATPVPLLEALARRGQEAQLKNVELIHIHTEGHDTVVAPEFEGKGLLTLQILTVMINIKFLLIILMLYKREWS